jgi:uncharacterized membrane protein
MSSRLARWRGPLVAMVVIAVAVHLLVVLGAPRGVMAVAGPRISDQAGGDNRWLHAPPVTSENQQVVRSSPDLAYSACRFDLSDGPVRISAPGWDSVWSLSLYDARTDNIAAIDDREGADVLVGTADQVDGLETPDGVEVVVSPDTTGVALLRYLTPTDADVREADSLRQQARCGPQ